MKVLIAGLVALLLALQYRLWFGTGSVQELWRVREEAHASRADVVALRSRNQALRAEVRDLKSGLAAVEERARTDLGMIDADETFYQFVRETELDRTALRVREEGAPDDVTDDAGSAPTESVPVEPAPPSGAPDNVGRIDRDGG